MKIRKTILIFALILFSIVCLFSFVSYLYYSSRLNIQKIVLKSGIFDLSNKGYDFSFSNLKGHKYNIILKYFREKENDSNTKYRDGYTINVELRDQYNNLLMSNSIDRNGIVSESWSRKVFERYLISFNAEKGKNYKFKILFKSSDPFFDKVAKEIYVQEDYDYAALPWWQLFRVIFLIAFILTLIPVLIIGIILWRKKEKAEKTE